jgi:hypothetical protein
MNSYSSAQLSALTRLFSAAVFREMSKKGRSSLFCRLLEQTDLPNHANTHTTVGDIFDSAFEILKIDGHRDEYIYRTAITQKILLGKHSLRTASILNEFRTGSSKADVVILNGTATVYEIKSERDSLARISNQIMDYRRVFANVNVIASKGHIDSIVQMVPNDVGIMCLSKRFHISILRKAISCTERICPTTVFDSLRITESLEILKAMGVSVPELPNTQRHAALRALFTTLDPTVLHEEMVRTLKQTRNLATLASFVTNLPKSLQAAALSVSVPSSHHLKLINALKTPLHAAMTWR